MILNTISKNVFLPRMKERNPNYDDTFELIRRYEMDLSKPEKKSVELCDTIDESG